MAYYGIICKLEHVRKDPNSNNLWLADCLNEGVIVGGDAAEGELVLYLPTDGQIERFFGDKFSLFRKNEDGTEQGGYLKNNGHVRAIKLRGNHSSGITIPIGRVFEEFGEQPWDLGDHVSEVNGKVFCQKYIPRKRGNPGQPSGKTGYKGKKAEGIVYPEFSMHTDTEQLAYNLDKFRPGDELNITLKMHGTSQRSMRTYAELPNGFFRRLFKMKKRTKEAYVCGTRRTVVHEKDGGFYGSNEFREQHHKAFEPYIEPGMEVFYEVVGWYGPNIEDTIMAIGDNTKLQDKTFQREFGKKTIFSYGCEQGQSAAWVYRITSENGEKEWTPDEITAWCNEHGFNRVPVLTNMSFTDADALNDWINTYFEILRDPIGKTHVKEGVVVRIVNRRSFTAFKSKTYEFKVLEGIIKETSDAPDMEEADE